MSAAPIVRDTHVDRAASLAFTLSMIALIVMLPAVWVALAVGTTFPPLVLAAVGLATAGVWALTVSMFRYGLRG